MFERFTDRARQAILESQREAVEQHHDFIGTEHLLLGLLRVGSGVAHQVLTEDGVEIQVLREKVTARLAEFIDPNRTTLSNADALAAIGIDLGSVRARIEAAFGPGSLPDPGSTPSYTPKAKAALMAALRHALVLRQRYIGTEHVLLGLLDDHDTVATQALADLGVDLRALDQRVIGLIAPAEVRVHEAYLAVTSFNASAGTLPEDQRLAAAPVLAELSADLQGSLATELAEVVRLADETGAALEAALASARARLAELGVSL